MITVFAYYKNKQLSSRQKTALESFLSPREKETTSRFKREQDIEESLLSKYFKRKITSYLLGKSEKQIDFQENEYGRPFVSTPNTDIELNVSHSGDWLVVATGSGGGIGIDVERVADVDLDVCYNCFIDTELDYIWKSDSGKLERFFQLWTLKEAYLKYLGTGLSSSLKDFYCCFSASKVDILFSEKQNSLKKVFCYSAKLDSKHWFALIVGRNSWDEKINYIDLNTTLKSGDLCYEQGDVECVAEQQ